MSNDSMTTEAARMMLEAMQKLTKNEITPQQATGIAMLGKGVIDAANAEVGFIRVVRAVPDKGVFGTRMRYLEPECDKEALKALDSRIKKKDEVWP